MALIHTLLNYRDAGKVASFQMSGQKKATVELRNGTVLVVYMADQYIVGDAEVVEAAAPPAAQFLIYNVWDRVSSAAYSLGRRNGLEVISFGAFGHRLDEMNARP